MSSIRKFTSYIFLLIIISCGKTKTEMNDIEIIFDNELMIFNKNSKPYTGSIVEYHNNNRVKIEMKVLNGLKNERMAIASFSVRVQDLLRLMGSYGLSFDHANVEKQRHTVSGGIALVNQGFSLSYMASKPYLTENELHHGINLTISMAL